MFKAPKTGWYKFACNDSIYELSDLENTPLALVDGQLTPMKYVKRHEVNMKKLRKVGDITLAMEPLLLELAVEHELQMGEILALVKAYLEIHALDCIEQYVDGTRPIYYYGHKDYVKIRRGNG